MLKKALKIILVVLITLVILAAVAVGVLYITSPGLFSAVYRGFTQSGEDIEQQLKQDEQNLVDRINDFGFNISVEDMENLGKGNLTEQEMADLLLGNKKPQTDEENKPEQGDDTQKPPEENSGNEEAVENQEQTEQPQQSKPDNQDNPKPQKPVTDNKPAKTDKPQTDTQKPQTSDKTNPQGNGTTSTPDASNTETQKQIAEKVAKLYVLKSSYLGKIESVVASMKAEYAALPKEQQTSGTKASIAAGHLGEINSLEAQCDAQVNAIVSEIKELLKQSGQDMTLADSIMAAYNAEKQSTQAYYINKYS